MNRKIAKIIYKMKMGARLNQTASPESHEIRKASHIRIERPRPYFIRPRLMYQPAPRRETFEIKSEPKIITKDVEVRPVIKVLPKIIYPDGRETFISPKDGKDSESKGILPQNETAGAQPGFPQRLTAEPQFQPYRQQYPNLNPIQPSVLKVSAETTGSKKDIYALEKMLEDKMERKMEFPMIKSKYVGPEWKREDLKSIDIKCPLIPKNPTKDNPVLAFANIKWNPVENDIFYYVIEPKINQKEKDLIKKVKDLIEQKLDIDFSKIGRMKAEQYLNDEIKNSIKLFKFNITPDQMRIIRYYIFRDFIGMGIIEPMLRDPSIEDISCDGVDVPVYVYHRDARLGSFRSSVKFEDRDVLDAFISKLAQKCGKSVSVAEPLLDGSLPDGSRVQATLGTDIARKGSNFTIRKFTERPLTPVDLLKSGSVDYKMLAYMWLLIERGKSVLISGATATGKTTLLNVISLFIRPEKKILSIEDTPELRLPHTHWVPEVARLALSSVGDKKIGEVDMFDLLKESLRQRPDYIIVGEVRGKEAYVLFQQIATGHASISTIHADSISKLVNRLTTPPISLPPSLIENLDIIIFIVNTKIAKGTIRRAKQIIEVLGYDPEQNVPVFTEVFGWNPANDSFEYSKSIILKKIAKEMGTEENSIYEELFRRMEVLKWMKAKDMTDYKEVGNIIKQYYFDPEKLIASLKLNTGASESQSNSQMNNGAKNATGANPSSGINKASEKFANEGAPAQEKSK